LKREEGVGSVLVLMSEKVDANLPSLPGEDLTLPGDMKPRLKADPL
jgi:hypothetical protein